MRALCLFMLLLFTLAGRAVPVLALSPAQTELTGGGFLKLHLLHGDIAPSAQRRQGDYQLWAPHIPLDEHAAGDKRRFALNARDSRFWLRSQTPGAGHDLEFLLEIDLNESPQRHEIRLRHAYGRYGPLLAGQTFTTFTNTSALPDIEAGTAPGSIVTRHNMLRWTQSLNADTEVLFALEEPVSRLHLAGQEGFRLPGNAPLPDLAIRLHSYQDWGNISLAALTRRIAGTDVPGGERSKAWGGALSLAGRIESSGADNLRFMLSYGNALARYSTLATYADAVQDFDGSLQLQALHSSLLAWQHYWRPQWRSTFALSHAASRLSAGAHPDLTRSVQSAHINLVWAPVTAASLGLEYLYGQRTAADGRRGNVSRWLLTVRLNF